jgi:uncharacterized protein (DUF3084 family)
MLEAMKTRLKTTLDEKRDFEIEFLQLQKNFLKVKNENKHLKEINGEELKQELAKAQSEIEDMKKKLTDALNDVPDEDQIARLKKQMREIEIKHNDENIKAEEELRVA